MTDQLDLPPDRFAELVAPVVSRVFVTGMTPTDAGRRVVRDHGGPATGLMIDLRNPLAAGRPLHRSDLAAVYRYTDPTEIDAAMSRSVDHGLLQLHPDGCYRTTRAGAAFLDDLFAVQAKTLADRWGHLAQVVERLNATLAVVLETAATSGGPALAVQSPAYEPPDTSAELILLNRLSTLRYHRSDAHAAAWQAAGLTAEEVTAQGWGSDWTDQRRAVERDTNRRDARAYAQLTAGQRLRLLADLAALS